MEVRIDVDKSIAKIESRNPRLRVETFNIHVYASHDKPTPGLCAWFWYFCSPMRMRQRGMEGNWCLFNLCALVYCFWCPFIFPFFLIYYYCCGGKDYDKPWHHDKSDLSIHIDRYDNLEMFAKTNSLYCYGIGQWGSPCLSQKDRITYADYRNELVNPAGRLVKVYSTINDLQKAFAVPEGGSVCPLEELIANLSDSESDDDEYAPTKRMKISQNLTELEATEVAITGLAVVDEVPLGLCKLYIYKTSGAIIRHTGVEFAFHAESFYCDVQTMSEDGARARLLIRAPTEPDERKYVGKAYVDENLINMIATYKADEYNLNNQNCRDAMIKTILMVRINNYDVNIKKGKKDDMVSQKRVLKSVLDTWLTDEQLLGMATLGGTELKSALGQELDGVDLGGREELVRLLSVEDHELHTIRDQICDYAGGESCIDTGEMAVELPSMGSDEEKNLSMLHAVRKESDWYGHEEKYAINLTDVSEHSIAH